MKKYACFSVLALLLFAGCGKEGGASSYLYAAAPASGWNASGTDHSTLPAEGVKAKEGEVVEIREKMFIAQSNDIYYNPDEYMDKTIKYEGIFVTSEDGGGASRFVIRYGPGCCGYDGEAGFEVVWNGEYPDDYSWVEVVGALEQYEINGWPCLRLQLSSLKTLTTRGMEYVTQ